MLRIRKLFQWFFVFTLLSIPAVVSAQGTQGPAANGTAAKGNPVWVSGWDGTNVRAFKTDSTGQLYIANPGSGGGSTSITNQGGTNYLGVDSSGLIGLNNFPATQAVTQSGSWIEGIFGVNGSSIATAINPFPVYLQASSAVIGHVVTDSGSTTAVTGTVSTSRTWNLSSGSDSVTTVPSGTQTVSGTMTANAGTNLNTSALALESGGNLATIATNTGHIPTSPSTSANQTAVQSAPGTPQTIAITVQGNASGIAIPITGTVTTTPSGTQTVAGTITANQGGAWNVGVTGTPTVTANAGTGTFSVSASSLPLPAGAATSAKQPALGTAGAASADVITVQGVAGMTAVKTDGSGVTQPVSGTVAATQSGTWTNTVTQATGSNLHVQVDTAPTTTVTGTVTANLGTLNGAALDSTLTGGTQTTRITDGTNTASVIAPGTSGQNAQLVGAGAKIVTFSTSTVQAVADTDCTNLRSVCVWINTQGTSSAVAFQQSQDDTNWINVPLMTVTNAVTASPSITTGNANSGWRGNIYMRYFRLNVTGISAGTTAGTCMFYTSIFQDFESNAVTTVGQNGTWTVQPGNTANTTPWNVVNGGTTTVAIASGTSANTIVKGSAGHLCRVLVTTTNTNPMVIYDNASTTSGTIIGALPASPAVGTVYDFQMPAAAGITVGGNAANPGVTISYSN